ncbi:MAG: MATE family efflux transporter, partial [Herpetosiphonaceae bacterium]|nr:MATE family efflux transporter [Herpetosiphonaceae bacterium]
MSIPVPSTVARGSQRGIVLRLGLPAVGEQLLSLMVGLVDTYVVGHLSLAVAAQMGYSRETALASVGIAGQINWTLMTLFMAVALGCTVVVARFVGAGERDLANRALRQALLIGLLMGGLALLLAYVFAPQLLAILGAAPEVRQNGAGYLRISTLAFPLTALLFIGNAALRGSGDTRTPLLVMLVVNGINAVLSSLLVNGNAGLPALGINGAAIGAGIGQSVGGLIIIAMLIRGRSGLRVSQVPRPERALMWRILRQGLPYGAEQFVFQAALLVFVHFITGIGTTAYAAHTTIITIESISFLPGMGIAVAATTLVGQSMGAKRPDIARESGYESFRMGALLMAFFGVLFIF